MFTFINKVVLVSNHFFPVTLRAKKAVTYLCWIKLSHNDTRLKPGTEPHCLDGFAFSLCCCVTWEWSLRTCSEKQCLCRDAKCYFPFPKCLYTVKNHYCQEPRTTNVTVLAIWTPIAELLQIIIVTCIDCGFISSFIGFLATTRDNALHMAITHTSVNSHFFTIRCLVAASNGIRSPSSGFPNCPWPRLPAYIGDSSQHLNRSSSLIDSQLHSLLRILLLLGKNVHWTVS
jgi:hypothetical protein